MSVKYKFKTMQLYIPVAILCSLYNSLAFNNDGSEEYRSWCRGFRRGRVVD